MSAVRVRDATAADRSGIEAFLAARGHLVVARLDELVDTSRQPALVAHAGDRVVGVLTWIDHGDSLEVLTLHADPAGVGTGSLLLDRIRQLAATLGRRRIWLITTNDNLDALRFYQRRGFRLARLHPGAVDRSRAARKPSIPAVGDHGIPIRDEVELDLWLEPDRPATAAAAAGLEGLELALARRDEGSIPGGYAAVLAPDFVEHGQSGRRWSRDETLAALVGDPRSEAPVIERFMVDALAESIALVTYDLVAEHDDRVPRRSRRSSVWVHRDGRWQLRFHQGTSLPTGQA